MLTEVNFNDRRKAVRVESDCGVQAIYTSGGMALPDAVLVDFSTQGLAIRSSIEPDTNQLDIQFTAPEILAGLRLSSIIRRKELSDDGKYIIGVEFLFSSPDQHHLLLRWLSGYFQKQLNPEPIPGGTAAEYRIQLRGLPQNSSVGVRFPHDDQEMEKCLFLLQPFEVHYLLMQTKIFMMVYENEISAIQGLIPDTELFRLPSDRFCRDYFDAKRAKHRKLGEITLPKFDENSYLIRHCKSSILTKLNLLFSTFIYLITYATYLAQLTDLFVTVPTYLQEFYRLWLFSEAKDLDHDSRRNLKDRGELSLMHLDLEMFTHQAAQLRPEITKQLAAFHTVPGSLNTFTTTYSPHSSLLEQWLKKKKDAFNLSPDQLKYFASLATNLPF